MFNAIQQFEQHIVASENGKDLSFIQQGRNDKYVDVWDTGKGQYLLKPLSALSPGEFFQFPEQREQTTSQARCFHCRSKPRVTPVVGKAPDIVIEDTEVVKAPPEFINHLRSSTYCVEMLIPFESKTKLGRSARVKADVHDLAFK
jgi:hypothetical protein